VRRHTFAALLLVAVACTDSSSPTQQKAASFGIRPAVDTVTVGDSVTFVAERADSTVDEWSVSDPGVARITARQLGRARVIALAAGTVIIDARRQLDSGQATLIILPAPPPPPPPPPPPAGSFGIRPALDTVIAGDLVKFVAERPDSTIDQWIVSDTSTARLLAHERAWCAVRIRARGTVTIKARRGADSGQATLVILPADTTPDPVTVGDWEAISLGLLGAEGGRANAIDDSGTIVGSLVVPAPINALIYGFIYKNGVMQKLWSSDNVYTDYLTMAVSPAGMIAGSTSGSGGGELLIWDNADAAPRLPGGANHLDRLIGFNARGDLLVDYGDHLSSGSGVLRTVLYKNNVPEELGSLNDTVAHSAESAALAWNARGQIVGGSKVASISQGDGDWSELFHPFIWENGVMRDLGSLTPLPCTTTPNNDCSAGWATGINAHGVVVGMSSVDRLWRAFIWESGAMRDLGVFPGHSTTALAINDRDQVMGFVGAASYDSTFFWDNGRVQLVTTTAVNRPDLGPNGEVVGTMRVGGEAHAFVWQAGVLTDLGPGWASDINSRGEIVGSRGNMPTLWRRKS
jgi:probable HAF family extracellular repeat protein